MLLEDMNDFSSKVAKSLPSKINTIRSAYLSNISEIKSTLSSANIDPKNIQKQAIILAKDLRTMTRRLRDNPSSNKPQFIKLMMVKINLFVDKLLEDSNIDPEDNKLKLSTLMLFSSTFFTMTVRYIENLSIMPINLTSLYFGPLFEELGTILNKKYEMSMTSSGSYTKARPISRWIVTSMYSGKFRVPYNIVSMAVNTINKTNSQFLSDPGIQRFTKIKLDEEALETVNQIFTMTVLGTFIGNITPYIVKISNTVVDLRSEPK